MVAFISGVVVGVLELELAVPALSLKEKRGVVKRVVHRVRNNFNVSAAEVDEQDSYSVAVLGFASVGNDARYLEGQLKKIEAFVDRLELAEITDSSFVLERF